MEALDHILDGLEDALALERELGTRAVEIDRALLAVPQKSAPPAPAPAAAPRPGAEKSAPPIPARPESAPSAAAGSAGAK